MVKKLTLILGGARSGKSRYAEQVARQANGEVWYVATGEANDAEMAERIALHRVRRPSEWRTLEAPVNVSEAIDSSDGNPEILLLDCITLLANNVFGREVRDDPPHDDEAEPALMDEIEALLSSHQNSPADWLIVSNEVGLGLVPPFPLGRAYRDALGRANQRLAEAADEVILVVAGQPLLVKSPPPL